MLKRMNITSKEQILIVCILLAAVTLAVYWQVRHFDFVFDDVAYVTENNHLRSGITAESVRWAFSTKYFGLWNPLIWLSLMLDYQLYGLHPGAYHMTNLILHILTTLLLFSLFHRMTGALWKSAFVAAFFALHPLHVESVAWIAERKDVLSAFFWMLTLYLYAYYAENPSAKKYLLVLLAFVCALMSKPMVVTLPVVMILLDYWPLKRFESNKNNPWLWQLKEKWPLFVLSAVFSMITVFAQYKPHAMHFSFHSRLTNSLCSFAIYLEKTFWPHDLAVFYPFDAHIALLQVSGATVLLITISLIVVLLYKRCPFLFTGWFWFVITLLPVIGIIQVGKHALADRYHYLPSIGIAVMIAWGLSVLMTNDYRSKRILSVAGVAFMVIMTLLTWKQCGYWKDNPALFTHALKVTKNNYIAHDYVALSLFAEGKYEKAKDHFDKALIINPDYVETYNNRGMLYAETGHYEKALVDFNRAIRMKSDYADAYYNRGLTYNRLGHHQQAFDDYSRAILLNPEHIKAYNNRGIFFFRLGDYQSAIQDFGQAITLKTDYAEAYFNRGITYAKIGKGHRALEDFSNAIRIEENFTHAYGNRAAVHFKQGNHKLGCADARKACALGNCTILQSADCR